MSNVAVSHAVTGDTAQSEPWPHSGRAHAFVRTYVSAMQSTCSAACSIMVAGVVAAVGRSRRQLPLCL